MAKYLDYTGLSRVWNKIKEKMAENNAVTLELIKRERAINGFCTLMVDSSFANATTIPSNGYKELTRDMVDATGVSRSNITRVIIGAECTDIESFALSQCSSLESVTIGNNVKTIGQGAFAGATKLASLVIPASVTSIGGSAFSSGVSIVRVYAATPPTLGAGAFGVYSITIYVPADSVDAYKQAWSDYANYIQAMP